MRPSKKHDENVTLMVLALGFSYFSAVPRTRTPETPVGEGVYARRKGGMLFSWVAVRS